jgi:iron complex outermembrane receptor protein
MLTPSRRVGVFSGVEYKVAPRVTAFARALFNNRQSTNQAAPEPLFIGPEAGNGNRLDTISIDVTNPYNPFGFTLDAATNPYFIGRRPLEAGPRIFNQNVNTWYMAGGLRGDFKVAESSFQWDATAVYAINRADQIKHGGFNSAKLQKALGPVDLCLADPDCVPFNISGGQGANGEGSITPEMLDYVTFVQKDVSEQSLLDVTANVAGQLVRLPAGWLGVAAGVEHRQQSGFFQPDAVVVAGDTAGVPSSPTAGEFTANETYAEVRVPLASKVPGANLLDLSGAVRISDYSTFGVQSTFKVGARWRPNQDLLLRGNFSQGFRAPGIGELFGSKARFDQGINDPCSDMLGLSGGTPAPQSTIDNCVMQGVPADGSYEQLKPQISVTTGGNQELEPETSDSYTVSLVYSPTWLEENQYWVDSLDIELTYYNIRLGGAIQAVNAQAQLDLCIQTLDPVMCDGIMRTPTGTINGFDNQLRNIGSLRTDGIDVTMSYRPPRTSVGGFRVTSMSSYLLNFIESIPASGGFTDLHRDGTEVGDPEHAYPRFKSSLILDWFQREWRASWSLRYIHSVTESCPDLADFPGTCSKPDPNDDSNSKNVLDPTFYNDVQVTWTPRALDDQVDVTVGVNNLFNQQPPKCYSCALNGFDATTYDIPGVFGYVKAGYRMW